MDFAARRKLRLLRLRILPTTVRPAACNEGPCSSRTAALEALTDGGVALPSGAGQEEVATRKRLALRAPPS